MIRGKTRGLLGAALVALACGASSAVADEMLYYVEDATVVFTNVPSRPAVEPVPGFEPALRVGGAGPSEAPYHVLIERVSRDTGVSASLIRAVARVESGFDPTVVSPKGAQGLMQLMPETAARYGVTDPFDPSQNLRAGALHLRSLMGEFADLSLVLAAYNAGSGAVRRHGGVPSYPETRDYVRRVHRELGRRPARTGAVPQRGTPSAAQAVQMQRGEDGSLILVN